MNSKNRAAARFRKARRASRNMRAWVMQASPSAIIVMQGNSYQFGPWTTFNLVSKWAKYKSDRRMWK